MIKNPYYKGDLKPKNIDRREFLKHLGGGVIVVYTMGNMTLMQACSRKEEEKLADFNAFLRIGEDGKVDCFSGKIEMGQGVNTSIPQVLAEELEVDMHSIHMVMGDTELCPFDEGTWGSMTTRFHDPLIRAAAAEAREILKELASKKLDVAIDQLIVKNGVVYDSNDESKKISYAELTRGQKIVKTLNEKPPVKKASEFNLIGKSFYRLDAEEKVTGKALYSGDIRLPGMKYAAIKRPPAIGATLKSADTSAAESMEGVEIIRENDFIVALHDYPETAIQAAAKIKAEWEPPQVMADDKTIFDYIVKSADESEVVEQSGDLEAGKKGSEIVVEEQYVDGYKAHASIETHTATAVFEDGKLTMWASSQTPFGTRQAISDTFKLPLEKVHLKQIYLGGGFGGKIYNHQAIEAARIAILSKKPIQLAWSRREEFMYDLFHTAGVIRINSGVSKDGKINHW
ncbi:MAG TPA: molybdopterin cofactor-binding domain-containing protein, partial [Cyclobacteriaceae bacterium]|nr:molybdopterin cofactor-binding domain-containing protein [Cyclobacteriaceae bacterium]